MIHLVVFVVVYIAVLLAILWTSIKNRCSSTILIFTTVVLHWFCFGANRFYGNVQRHANVDLITATYLRHTFFRQQSDPTDQFLLDYMVGFKNYPVNKVGLLYSPEEYTQFSIEKNRDYEHDLKKLFKLIGRNMPARLPIDMGDVMYLDDCLVLSKSRAIGGNQTVLPLDMNRHAGFMQRILDGSIGELPYEQKSDTLVWRGGTNGMTVWANTNRFMNDKAFQQNKDVGNWWNIHQNPYRTPQNGRGSLVDQYGDASWCDIGFSKNTCGIQRRLKPYIKETEWVNHKIMLCMEGNDVASSLRWMIAADSVVLMPTPTCETCFCEGLLKPWVHYVPLNDDLSDLKEKYDWILRNPVYAKELRQRSRQWAQRLSVVSQRNFGAQALELALTEMGRLRTFTEVRRQTVVRFGSL